MDTPCLHCDAKLSGRELADGWCDTCGKRLPSGLRIQHNREAEGTPAVLPPGNAISAGTILLVGVMALALIYLAVAALLGDAGSAAAIVKLGVRLAVFAAVAAPIALLRAAVTD
jgi:hypothetical protein